MTAVAVIFSFCRALWAPVSAQALFLQEPAPLLPEAL
jgi:hypothetical protein